MPPQNFSIDTVDPMQPNSVWLSDDILYINFNQPFNMEAVQEVNGESNRLREAAGLSYVPTIVIFTNRGKSLDLSLADLSNASVSATLEAVSTMIVVGLEGTSLQLAKVANKFTFNNRLIFCNTLQEAVTAAQPFKGTDSSILDQDKF